MRSQSSTFNRRWCVLTASFALLCQAGLAPCPPSVLDRTPLASQSLGLVCQSTSLVKTHDIATGTVRTSARMHFNCAPLPDRLQPTQASVAAEVIGDGGVVLPATASIEHGMIVVEVEELPADVKSVSVNLHGTVHCEAPPDMCPVNVGADWGPVFHSAPEDQLGRIRYTKGIQSVIVDYEIPTSTPLPTPEAWIGSSKQRPSFSSSSVTGSTRQGSFTFDHGADDVNGRLTLVFNPSRPPEMLDILHKETHLTVPW